MVRVAIGPRPTVACLYDASGLVVSGAGYAVESSCFGKLCWKENATGFQYKYNVKVAEGMRLRQLNLKGSDVPEKAKIALKGRSAGLGISSPAALTAPLRMQLRRTDGACWEATFSGPFLKQDATQLKARSD